SAQGTALSGVSVSAFSCLDTNPIFTSGMACKDVKFAYDFYKLQFNVLNDNLFRKYYTCYQGESLGYTLNGARSVGGGKKLFCGTNSTTKAAEWQWSMMDGSDAAPIPLDAKMSCF
ncbi:hypothetical protein PMAYCL1PPCAC_05647, partial [Pristionchus mayeri]